MKQINVKADNYTYSTLFKGIRHPDQSKELERAFEIFEREVEKPDEILFNVLLDACINCKQLERAVALVKKLNEKVDEGRSVKPDEISFNTIIKGCA